MLLSVYLKIIRKLFLTCKLHDDAILRNAMLLLAGKKPVVILLSFKAFGKSSFGGLMVFQGYFLFFQQSRNIF